MSEQPAKKKSPRIWHEKHQEVLKSWGESAACYRFMHFQAYQYYKKRNMFFTLPIIVIGTVTGTANFAQTTFPKDAQPFVPSVIGAMNLFSAILTTVAQFLKIAELMESHRVSYISYGKLTRNIKLEITLPVSERTHHGANMIDICGAEYDRLIEQCPPIPKTIMKRFSHQFPEEPGDPKDFKFTRPEFFSVKPFEEHPFDPPPTEPETKSFAFKPLKWKQAKADVVQELDELNQLSRVRNHIAIDVVPSRGVNLDDIAFDEGSTVSETPDP
jgi:hypothetical protein